MSPERRVELQRRVPLGRLGTPEDVARVALFLAQATYITGQTFTVDGGLSLTALTP